MQISIISVAYYIHEGVIRMKIKNIYTSKNQSEYKQKCTLIHRRCLILIQARQGDTR